MQTGYLAPHLSAAPTDQLPGWEAGLTLRRSPWSPLNGVGGTKIVPRRKVPASQSAVSVLPVVIVFWPEEAP